MPSPQRTAARPRLLRLLPALALPLLLAGCLSRSDSLAPIISITEPKSGTTRSTDVLDIYGYAMDDRGIGAIRVNGTDLLQFPGYEASRGKGLVRFAFRGNPGREGEVEYLIEVEDSSGRVSVLPYRLQIDTTPPTLELEAEALGDGRYRLRGVARDNTAVSTIRIGGVPLQFAPGPEVALDYNIRPESPTIEVVDSAGNSIERSLP